MRRRSSSYPTIHGYEIQECIGKGSVGEVYRGIDAQAGATVAIKILRPDIVASDPEAVERFVREAEVLRSLNHPNIVKVLATMEENGVHYLITEYIPGGSLREFLEKEGQLSIERVVEIALDLVDALTRAHRLGIIHRDIKPSNILLKGDSTPLLSDFGLAGVRDSKMTQVGTLMGTPAYLSPEVCQGQEADARADIWAFGVMLFEMLTGQLPFEGINFPAIIMAIITQPTPDLEALRPDAPVELINLIYQMLEKDRQSRLSSVRLLGADLEAMMQGTKCRSDLNRAGELQLQTVIPEPQPLTEWKIASKLPAFLSEEIEEDRERPLFVARQRELERLDGFLEDDLRGKGSVVFITGEAGSGKTALVQEFSYRAQNAHAGLIVASGNCNAHTGIGDPYLPFREALEMLTGEVEALWAAGAITHEHTCRLWKFLPIAVQALVQAGPDLIDTFVPGAALVSRAKASAPAGSEWIKHLEELAQRKASEPIGSSQKQSDLFEQYTRVLQALTQKAPLVLVLDDLQWADNGSISLLFHLGRNLAGNRILIVGTFRPEEIAMGRDGTRHPLEAIVNELQRLFGHNPIDVNQAESRDFMDALLDSEPNLLGTAFREMLYHQTHGQPLFTVELLRGMQERGDLVQDQEGFWNEGPMLNLELLPARVEAVIGERVARLDQLLQEVLRVSSVEGETFTAEVTAQVLESNEQEILSRLSSELDRKHQLVRAQSIQRMNGQLISSYRFQHILLQRFLYSSLDEVERVRYHEAVGNTLEALYEHQPEALQAISVKLARHYLEARSADKAIHYLHLAGEKAVQLSAYQEAITHLVKGIELLNSLPDSPQRAKKELDLQMTLAKAWSGPKGIHSLEAKNALIRAREICLTMGESTQLSHALGGLALHHFVRAEYLEGRNLGEQALCEALRVNDPILIALGHWYLGVILFFIGDYVCAKEHLEQMIAFYDPQQHHRSLVVQQGVDAGMSAYSYLSCCLWCLGYPDQANSVSQKAITLARERGHPLSLADVLCYAGCMFAKLRRDWWALFEYAQELMKLSQEFVLAWRGTASGFYGEALAMLGKVEEGIIQIKQSVASSHSSGANLDLPGALLTLSESLSSLNQVEEALTTLAEGSAMVEHTDERHWQAEFHRLRAKILILQGNEVEAEASLMKAIEVARDQEARSWELRATTSLARLWRGQGRIDEARQALAQIYGWFSEGFDTSDLKEAKMLLDELS